MKKINVILLILIAMFLVCCAKDIEEDHSTTEPVVDTPEVLDDEKETPKEEEPINEINPFLGLTNSFEIFVGEKIDFGALLKGIDFDIETDSININVNGKVVEGVNEGETKIILKKDGFSLEVRVKVNLKPGFDVSDVELFVGEKVDIPLTLTNCSITELRIEKDNNNIEINDGVIEGVSVGETNVKISLGEVTKTIKVTVKQIKVTVLNGNVTIDCLETLKLELDYPKDLVKESDITYYLYKDDIIEIIDNVIYPIREGKVKVRVQVKDDKTTSSVFEVSVTVDPVAIFRLIHQEEAKMLKEIRLYGEDSNGNEAYVSQEFYGSVSYYFFDSLNLVERIIDIYDNPYVGKVATPEIINEIDKKKNKSCPGYPRSGVLLTGINYITYHDTGNFNAGAKALSNANWMTNSYSIAGAARSWHYTVDDTEVIHSIPDNEVTFQGDHYTAYTESIGIETVVNQGANLDKVWHRMGKLCAKLMTTYGIDVDHIRQHYDWMGKNCPQTLRMNGLYSYAIEMVKAELMVRKYLSDYTIKFESLTPEYLDNTGSIIKAPTEEITVSYKLTITNNNGYNEEVVLSTVVKPVK